MPLSSGFAWSGVCAGHCRSLIVISCQLDITTRKSRSHKYLWCWVITWTSVFKVCWRQWLLLGFGSGAAWCCLCWRFLGCPQFVWRSRAWHQVLFLRVLQNVIGLWCNGIPSCCSRFTQIGMAGTSMHAQASKNLKPPPKAMPDVFINVTGHWDGLGLECLPGVWGTRCSVPCFAPDFIFCLRQVTSVLWLSSLAVQWKQQHCPNLWDCDGKHL